VAKYFGLSLALMGLIYLIAAFFMGRKEYMSAKDELILISNEGYVKKHEKKKEEFSLYRRKAMHLPKKREVSKEARELFEETEREREKELMTKDDDRTDVLEFEDKTDV